jgi:hypothetical protein
MRKSWFLAAAMASALMFSGCALADGSLPQKETEASIHQKIVPGQTTDADIRAMFGEPDRFSVSPDGREMMIYNRCVVILEFPSYIPIVNIFYSPIAGTKDAIVIVIASDKKVESVRWLTQPLHYNAALVMTLPQSFIRFGLESGG